MGWGRSAAATDRGDAELGDEAGHVLAQLLGGEVVVHGPVHHAGQACIGEAGDRDDAVLGEVAQWFAHLDWAGGAVQADDVDPHGLESRQRGADLGAGQHPPGQLDRDLDLDRHLSPGVGHGEAAAVDGGLGAEEVEHRLDDEQVDTTGEQAGSLLSI